MLERAIERNLRIRILNRSAAPGDLSLVLTPTNSQSGQQAKGFTLSRGQEEAEASLPTGTYVALAYAASGHSATSGAIQVIEGRPATIELQLEKGATLSLTMVRAQEQTARTLEDLQFDWWDGIRNGWTELTFLEKTAASAPAGSTERKLQVPVPAGRIRVRRGKAVLREITCASSENLDLGRLTD